MLMEKRLQARKGNVTDQFSEKTHCKNLKRNTSSTMKWIIVFLLISGSGLKLCAQLSTDKKHKIDALIKSYVATKQFNGNVSVGKDGKPVFSKSYGYADFELKVPNKEQTRFRIGSMTKQFTAMLIMQLKQQGKLDLDSAIITYLPWYRKETGSKISVRNLIAHTSGLKNYTARPDFHNTLAYLTIDPVSFAKSYCQEDLEYEPGNQFKYCNTDYYLLGLIVEAVSGKTYAEALREQILDKAGMQNTGIDSIATVLPERAKGYEYGYEGYVNAAPINMATSTYAAGAMYSTVKDLLLWQKALKGTSLLSEENKKIFFTPGQGNYAFGLYVNKTKDGKTVIGHPGGISGFSSFMIRFIEDDITIILLDNTTSGRRGNLDNTSLGIYSILMDKSYELPKKSLIVDLTETFLQKGVEAMIARYKLIRTDTAYDISKASQFLNNFGYSLLTNKRIKESLVVLKLAADDFSGSANTLDSYAEALMADKQYALAIEYYQKILKLEPGNKSAINQIGNIKELIK
jgi:CubicO group peptidase (beta-lactamase class C family)